MNRVLTLLVLVVCSISVFAGDGVVRRAGKPVAGQYIAVLEDSVTHGRSQIAADLTFRFRGHTRLVFAGFNGFLFEGTHETAQAISRDPRVAWVEENAIGEPAQAANSTTRPFPPGWAIDRGGEAMPPLDSTGGPGCGMNGEGVHIYVMDGGINDVDGAEFSYLDGRSGSRLQHLYKVLFGSGMVYGDTDAVGHGTAVASLAAGNRHGLARNSQVRNVKIANNGFTNTAYLIDGISRIDVDHYNRNRNNPTPLPSVVNISYYLFVINPSQTEANFSALDQAIQNSVRGCSTTEMVNYLTFDGFNVTREQCTSFNSAPQQYGLTYVVSAGNENSSAVTGTPARLGDQVVGTITVGATMMRDEWTTDWRGIWPEFGANKGSNYGPKVDIWAPGTKVNVFRRDYGIDPVTGAPTVTREETGTSMASPFVAGVVARLARTYSWYTSQQLEGKLKSDAVSTYPDGVTPMVRDIPGGRFVRYFQGKCRP